MERSTKVGLTILGSTILAGWLVVFFVFIFPAVRQMNDFRRQMLAGQKYMDSLTEKDVPVWIGRTKKYLDDYGTNSSTIEVEPVSPDLQQLKIVTINYVAPNLISYVWVGGFDHTSLDIERMTNGEFQFTAVYDDESNKVIWPKNAAR